MFMLAGVLSPALNSLSRGMLLNAACSDDPTPALHMGLRVPASITQSPRRRSNYRDNSNGTYGAAAKFWYSVRFSVPKVSETDSSLPAPACVSPAAIDSWSNDACSTCSAPD